MGGETATKGGGKAASTVKASDRYEQIVDKLKREIEMILSKGIKKVAALPKKYTYAKEVVGKCQAAAFID